MLKQNPEMLLQKPDKISSIILTERYRYLTEMLKIIDDESKFTAANSKDATLKQLEMKAGEPSKESVRTGAMDEENAQAMWVETSTTI